MSPRYAYPLMNVINAELKSPLGDQNLKLVQLNNKRFVKSVTSIENQNKTLQKPTIFTTGKAINYLNNGYITNLVSVFDVTGKLIETKQFTGNNPIQFVVDKAGIYIIQATQGGDVLVNQKVVVE
jgi:DNA-binding beta-propeller fold protein YncE